jgi:predicted NAD/FAD-binding protein
MPSVEDTGHGRPRIAVVGSGVAGLTAAYVLQRTHDVTLYEADDRIGGHAHTHDVTTGGGATVAIDTGFIVHNERTYPTLLRLFAELGVATQDTEMSLSVRCDGCGLEYCGGRGPLGVIATGRSLTRPRYLKLLTEVTRFRRRARTVLAAGNTPDEPTLGRFLAAGAFSPYFIAHFMTPMVAAVWSCSPASAMLYPARYLFTFLDRHGLLSNSGSPTWRTVVGGSRTYVERAVKDLTAVHTSTPIRSITRCSPDGADRVAVHDDDDRLEHYAGVVIATHPDQALRLLADRTSDEQAVLGAFTYSRNPTVLHTDDAVLPRAPRARASWNYRMASCADQADAVRITYDMTRLQRLDTTERFLVSLNAGDDVHPERIIERMTYLHPQFTPESVAAQTRLPSLRDGVTAFAGAYEGWGFHEDGARSGLLAAESLGGSW